MQGTVQRDKHYVYATCERCNAQNVLVYSRGGMLLCAEDTRRWIAANPVKQTCDRCGEERDVLRDPSHRRNEYLCTSCHADDGFAATDTVTGRAFRSVVLPPKLLSPKIKCQAAGYGSDCDDNVKPRGPWGGKLLCNRHGKTPPPRESKTTR